MTDICPHCGDKTGPDGCWPYDKPEKADCWELKVASASDHLHCEVYVTKGEQVSPAAVGLLETVRELEGE